MNNLGRLYDDLVTTAQLVEAPYSEPVIKRFLQTFEEGFSRGAIQFRTTTKSQRRLDVRFEVLNASEQPLAIARRTGLLPDQGRDIDRVMSQVYQHFPHQFDGADFDINEGLTKVWFFALRGLKMEEAFPLSAMPRSVANHAWLYDKYQVGVFSVVGVDYRSQSVNLYVRLDQPHYHTPEFVKGFVKDLGFATPSDEIVTYSLQSPLLALTYTWASSEIERASFYVPRPNRETSPSAVHPIIKRFVEQAPLLQDPAFIISYTFGAKGTYIKLENDYTGTTFDMFGRIMVDQIPASV